MYTKYEKCTLSNAQTHTNIEHLQTQNMFVAQNETQFVRLSINAFVAHCWKRISTEGNFCPAAAFDLVSSWQLVLAA